MESLKKLGDNQILYKTLETQLQQNSDECFLNIFDLKTQKRTKIKSSYPSSKCMYGDLVNYQDKLIFFDEALTESHGYQLQYVNLSASEIPL